MATKKKAAAKKTVLKPSKKKVTKKRAYTRRKKVDEVLPTEEIVETVQLSDQANKTHDDIVDASPFGLGLGMGYAEAQSNEDLLSEIEVIDMRGLDEKDRFGILSMLDNEGYLTDSVKSLLKDSNLLIGLEAETLVLNHRNKLVSTATWQESSTSGRISRPSVRLTAYIGFSPPEPVYEDAIRIGNAQYVRIA